MTLTELPPQVEVPPPPERVAEKMRFKPALNHDRPIGVWVAQRITFSVRG